MIAPLTMETIQLGKGWFPEESGGLDRYYRGLVSHLPRIGVGVRGLVAGSKDVEQASDGKIRSFAPTRSSLLTRWNGVRAQARRALAERPGSLLVAHFALYAAPCLGLIRNDPFVVHFQGPWARESMVEGAGSVVASVKHLLERSVYRRATRFLVLSQAFARVLEQYYRAAPERIRVIPGGVDTAQFAVSADRQAAREELGWPTDRPIVFVVRRLVRRMGLEDLIESVHEARRQVPDLLVMIAGSGPLAAELEARRQDPVIAKHVRLLGFVPDAKLPLAYRAADLSVVPSVALEGFGLVVVESLAAGTPVLVTNVGGLPETVEGLCPDAVIQERGAPALAAAITSALLGRIRLPDADACAQFARERYDWSVVARKVGEVYSEATR